MREVFFTVQFKGKNYHTNVIAQKDMTWETIKTMAEQQVAKQWGV